MPLNNKHLKQNLKYPDICLRLFFFWLRTSVPFPGKFLVGYIKKGNSAKDEMKSILKSVETLSSNFFFGAPHLLYKKKHQTSVPFGERSLKKFLPNSTKSKNSTKDKLNSVFKSVDILYSNFCFYGPPYLLYKKPWKFKWKASFT